MVYLLWFTYKYLLKNPRRSFKLHKPAKTMLFDWPSPWKFLIFIIRFFWGKADQVSGALFILSSVVNFGQVLPIRSTHFGFFLLIFIEICQEIELISNLCYNTVLKKIVKTFTNCSFRTLFGQKFSQQRPCPKSSSKIFFEITKGDHKLSRTFYFIKIS